MFGPCWDHVWPSFTFRPARSLKYLRLSQFGLMQMSYEVPTFWDHVDAMYIYHAGTMFGLALLLIPMLSTFTQSV